MPPLCQGKAAWRPGKTNSITFVGVRFVTPEKRYADERYKLFPSAPDGNPDFAAGPVIPGTTNNASPCTRAKLHSWRSSLRITPGRTIADRPIPNAAGTMGNE